MTINNTSFSTPASTELKVKPLSGAAPAAEKDAAGKIAGDNLKLGSSPVVEGAVSVAGGVAGAAIGLKMIGRVGGLLGIAAPFIGAIGGSLLASKLVSNRPMKDLIGGAAGGVVGALGAGGVGYGIAMMLGRGMGDGGFYLMGIPLLTGAIGAIAGTSIGKKLMSHVNISVSTK